MITGCLALLSNVALAANGPSPSLYSSLARSAPELNPTVLKSALSAVQCAVNNGEERSDRLAVIDYSQPRPPVACGSSTCAKDPGFARPGSPRRQVRENFATQFSNLEGSHQSSLGLFRTQESYLGAHGYSLRMDGLEPGFNDQARDRAIVIHAADYVSPLWSKREGRIGRSQGCPAVRPQVARQVVDKLKDGQFMFSWYPDQRWLKSSTYLNCKPQQVASSRTIRGG